MSSTWGPRCCALLVAPKPFVGMRVEVKQVLSFACYLIGRIAVRVGGLAHAISWFRTAVRFQESDTRALSWLGWSLMEAGAIEKAAAIYDNLVKLRPGDARSWFDAVADALLAPLARKRLTVQQVASHVIVLNE